MIINGQAEVTQKTGISSEVFSVGHLGPRLVLLLHLKQRKDVYISRHP